MLVYSAKVTIILKITKLYKIVKVTVSYEITTEVVFLTLPPSLKNQDALILEKKLIERERKTIKYKTKLR